MFRKYGIIGLAMILLAEIGLFFRLEPFTSFFFLFVWLGYILLLDAIVYKLQKNSLLMSHRNIMLLLLVLSAVVWWVFEIFNIFFLKNWYYIKAANIIGLPRSISLILATFSFATVLPAIFETANLLKAFHLFDHKKLRKEKQRHYIHKDFLFFLIILGIFSLVISLTFPLQFSGLIWIAFFLILDPINYMHHEPSIIGYIKRKEFAVPASFFIAGYIAGFFWEFWNFWAAVKWKYTLPVLGGLENIRIFEMPLLGYIPYGFFALELFAMYYFTLHLRKSLVHRKI